MQASGNKILITGGGSGIGLGLTERFVHDGNTVIICGRRESVLREVAERLENVIPRQADVAVESDRVALFEWIQSEHPDLNVLVNNAGIQNWMSIEDADFAAKMHDEIAINIEAPLHLTHLFLKLPALRVVMNVTSGLAFAPLTKTPVYSATKAFFHSWTLSLRHLLKDRGIEVIEIIPPALNTDLGGKGIHDFAPPVSGFIYSMFEQLQAGKQELTYQTSEFVSQADPEQLRQVFERMNAR